MCKRNTVFGFNILFASRVLISKTRKKSKHKADRHRSTTTRERHKEVRPTSKRDSNANGRFENSWRKWFQTNYAFNCIFNACVVTFFVIIVIIRLQAEIIVLERKKIYLLLFFWAHKFFFHSCSVTVCCFLVRDCFSVNIFMLLVCSVADLLTLEKFKRYI